MKSMTIWEDTQLLLEQKSVQRYNKNVPLAELCIAIIISGAREYDSEYVESDRYFYHCCLAGLEYDYVTNLIKYLWRKYPRGGGRSDKT